MIPADRSQEIQNSLIFHDRLQKGLLIASGVVLLTSVVAFAILGLGTIGLVVGYSLLAISAICIGAAVINQYKIRVLENRQVDEVIQPMAQRMVQDFFDAQAQASLNALNAFRSARGL